GGEVTAAGPARAAALARCGFPVRMWTTSCIPAVLRRGRCVERMGASRHSRPPHPLLFGRSRSVPPAPMNGSPEEIWNECLAFVRDNISRQSYRTWFEPLRAVALEEEEGVVKLTVQLPSRFYYEWLEEHYFALLRKTITKVLGPSGRLFYDIVIERDEAELHGAGHAAGAPRGGASMQLPARQPVNQPPAPGTPPPQVDGLPPSAPGHRGPQENFSRPASGGGASGGAPA